MKRKGKKRQEPLFAPGSSQGQSVTPGNVPQEESQQEVPEADDVIRIPLGVPVSKEEFRKLKSKSKHPQTSTGQPADKGREDEDSEVDES
jgi:hypothetical protein